jgi:N-acetylneuraminate lyase
MRQSSINGLIAAPFTPMYPDGSLNLDLIPEYYDMLLGNGINGAFICGSTGEGVSLTMEEKMAVADAWAACKVKQHSFTIMQLVGGTCLADCKKLAQHAALAGLDAVSFLAPFYFKPANVEMLAACCEEVASAASELPFYYYHIPVLTGVNFPMVDLLKAVDGRIPNFAGIKYTHEDLMDYLSCLNYGNGKFNILWGRDETFLSALAIGAKGAVGSTYNYAAPLYHRLMDAFHAGDLEQAASIQQKAIDMIELLGKYGGIATGKAFMKFIGLNCGEFRLPVKNMSKAAFEQFALDAERIGFNDFCSTSIQKSVSQNGIAHKAQ